VINGLCRESGHLSPELSTEIVENFQNLSQKRKALLAAHVKRTFLTSYLVILINSGPSIARKKSPKEEPERRARKKSPIDP
jgi:hypothetical protein